ncbi:ADP-ribosyl cyclase/cyclic ADP-ribose hydrolase [Citrus sinensis]|nr:ADP-ribosyl cyclase/cyclic ADP-ribose hydrolase [Citrus sinensis]
MTSVSNQNVCHWTYDVFLSFRGADTHKSFISHLYAALNGKGIYVFKDDKELEKGESISPRLLKAIEASRIAIIVFSKNYASSTWCLDELVHILDCKNKNAQRIVYPIFYDVEPTVVRNQTGNFQEAFAKHVEVFKKSIEKVQKWREALKEVANISGWELKEYRNESKFISDIVNPISSQIRVKSKILKKLVGIDSRLEELRFLMDKGPSADVRMIGICGSSFLANVREKSEREGGVISFQRQLVSQLLKLTDNRIWNEDDGINILGSRLQHKNVLLVIDDVVDSKQLEYLAGKHGWYGSGSRIIITSRDEGLLKTNGVDEVYKPNGLNYNEALQLFNMKAFKNNQPLEEHVQLSERFVNYAGGIPLAIEVLGSFLNVRYVEQWRSTLERLQIDPPKKIMSILQISFDRLQDSEKKIFLDIACFFKGKNRDYVTKILEGCGFFPVIGIEVLIERSLLIVDDDNTLGMHDLLQELGQLIVTRQSPEEPGKRSRLWKEKEVRQVLIENTGGEVMEGIIVNAYFPENEVYLSASAKAFSQMTNLRLLKISNVQLPGGLEYLSNRLRLLDWHRYPLKSLPSNLQLDKTIEFKMCYSRIEELWKGIKPLNMLKVMKLSHSQDLIKTPNFTEVSNLEELDLEGCTSLRGIHPSLLLHKVPSSIELLTGLQLLNLNNCNDLVRLPSGINGLKSLQTLNLSGCSKLENMPETLGQIESLEELDISGTAIRRPASSIFLMKNIKTLSFSGCCGQPSSTSWHLQFLFNWKRRSSDLGALRLISLSGSLKLLGNNGLEFSMLREYLKEVSDQRNFFFIVVPGSEIPKWFMYQNEGSSITVRRPSYLYNKNRVVGYAICSVFHVPKHSTGIKLWHSYPTHQLHCEMVGSNTFYFVDFREKFGRCGSDHLWLLYLSRQRCYDTNWHFESDHIELSFKPQSGPGLKVKRCGFHPVYMHEVEEFDQTTKKWTRFTSYNLNEFHHNFVGSNSEVATASKRSRAENIGATEASGSGCCDDVEEPLLKRFRQLE